MDFLGELSSLSALSSSSVIDHESLDRYRSSYNFELETVDTLPMQLVSEMRESTQTVLPDAQLPDEKHWNMFPVRLGKIIPKEYQPSGENTLVVFAPGWWGTAAGILPVGAAITEAIQKDRRPNATVGITLDSLVNEEPTVNALATTFPEYIANQAGALLTQIETFKSKKIVFVIHSLAALESIDTILTLEKLLKARGHTNVEIEAAIFAQIPGLYPQNIVSLIERTLEIKTDSAESRYAFPSPVDIEETKGLIALAHENGDMSSVHRLEKWLDIQEQRRARIGLPPVHENVSEGKNRYTPEGKLLKYEHLVYPENLHDNLPFIPEDDWSKLVRKDEELERTFVSSSVRRRLLKERAELLRPIIELKNATSETEKKQYTLAEYLKNALISRAEQLKNVPEQLRKTFESNVNAGLVLTRLLMGIPQGTRDQVQFRLCIAFAHNDLYYPSDEAWKKIEASIRKTGKQLFPHAQSVSLVDIQHWVHKGPSTDPNRFGEMVRNMVQQTVTNTTRVKVPVRITG